MGSLWMRRRSVVAGALVAGTVAAGTVVGGTLATVGSAMAAERPATTAQQALSRAGDGWALAMYASGRDTYRSRVTLYLTSPSGAAYVLRSWPHGTRWQLQAWSPDHSRAIFATTAATGSQTVVHQLTLATGATRTFTVQQYSRIIGYGLPAGRSLLVAQQSGIYLYSLTGHRLARLSASGEAVHLASGGAIMSQSGQEIVVTAPKGLSVVSPAGLLLRKLPVPHTTFGCLPMRWGAAGIVIASCMPSAPSSGPQVFKVPVSGAAPVAVTRVRNVSSGYFGSVDAWSIAGRTYVQAEQPCGAGFLGRLGARGNVVPVPIPGNPESTVVDSVHARRLLLTETGCENRNRLAVLTVPAGTARTILPYGRGIGAFEVVPFNNADTQP
jgi:hypothetical protein